MAPCQLCPIRTGLSPARTPIQPNYSLPYPPKLFCVGEGPARDETKKGYPFAGKSGTDLDHRMLPIIGFTREEVYVTNACKCPSANYDNPTPEVASCCTQKHLAAELLQFRPPVIMTIGAVAYHQFCAVGGKPLPNLQLQQGIPIPAELRDTSNDLTRLPIWSGILFPSYHPAAAMRGDTRIMQAIDDGCRNFRYYLAGTYRPLYEDPYLHQRDYREISGLADLESTIFNLHPPYVAIDTESDTKHGRRLAQTKPYCLTVSPKPATGYLIYNSDSLTLRLFREWIHDVHCTGLVFHNLPYDANVALESIGFQELITNLNYPDRINTIEDTMQMTFHTQRHMLSLKSLAYRLLGITDIEDFEDVVYPYAAVHITKYLAKLRNFYQKVYQYEYTAKRGKLAGVPVMKLKPGTPEVASRFGNVVNSALGATIRDQSNLEAVKEVVHRWDKWQDEYRILASVQAALMQRKISATQYQQTLEQLTHTYNLPDNSTEKHELLFELQHKLQSDNSINHDCAFPYPSIIDVPKHRLIKYACMDADITGRLYPIIKRECDMITNVKTY